MPRRRRTHSQRVSSAGRSCKRTPQNLRRARSPRQTSSAARTRSTCARSSCLPTRTRSRATGRRSYRVGVSYARTTRPRLARSTSSRSPPRRDTRRSSQTAASSSARGRRSRKPSSRMVTVVTHPGFPRQPSCGLPPLPKVRPLARGCPLGSVRALGGLHWRPGARPKSPILLRVTAQVEACRCSRHLSLDAHAAYLDCSSLLAQVHVGGGREAQATSLLVGNIASALKVRSHAAPCVMAYARMHPGRLRPHVSKAAALQLTRSGRALM